MIFAIICPRHHSFHHLCYNEATITLFTTLLELGSKDMRLASILLVEDDQSLLNGLADLLQMADFAYEVRIMVASNGEEGLAAMAHQTPDIIISDIMMPKMDGFAFMAQVRRQLDWVHIPFIFLTAKGNKQEIATGHKFGVELYITKPFVSNELIELVKTQLDRTFQLQMLRQRTLTNLKRNILQLLNHEFRTPLTYVNAYYQMLADGLTRIEDSHNLQEYLRGIQSGSNRLTHLVDDLIKVIQLRTGEARALYESLARPVNNAGELLREVAQEYEAEANQRGIQLIFRIEEHLPPIMADGHGLKDAFRRLLSNAIKFTIPKPAGTIKQIILTAQTSDDSLWFSVEDSGIGLPAHVSQQIFDPFYQYNREWFEQQGSGSGLTIAKGVAELHGGQILVESQEGTGSKFTIVLPIYHRERQTKSDLTHLPIATVLVVEDDRNLLNGLQELLQLHEEHYQIQVLTATNGKEGLEVLRRWHPDLIISDVMMPIMDGYQFLRQVRQNQAWLQIPFIFLTAKGESEDIFRGLRSGVDRYITKPYDIDELLSLVSSQLSRHFQIQQAVSQNFDALKQSILAMFRPDFQTPLLTVTAYSIKIAQSLQNAQTDADLMDSLQMIQGSSLKLTRLIEDFIALAEFKTGEAISAYETRGQPVYDLADILGAMVEQQISKGQRAQIEIRSEVHSRLPTVFCDVTGLLKGLERLFDIGVELSSQSPAGTIDFIAQEQNNQLQLLLIVHQAFFRAQIMVRLAQFFENPASEIAQLGEFGPALTVIHHIVQLHSGRLTIQNTAEQTTFEILLPSYRPELPIPFASDN